MEGRSMRVFGLAGWSGAGKTTLMKRLIPVLVQGGLRVSTVKHAHHGFDVDQPGKDSWEHRQAGATEVLVASGRRWALMHELRDEAEPGLADLVRPMCTVDLVLVEGFKRDGHPKLEVHRDANGKPSLYPDDPAIVGIATDASFLEAGIPKFGLDDVEAIATFVATQARPFPG